MKINTASLSLKSALYRRIVACAWIELCLQRGQNSSFTLDSLENAIAQDIEAFYIREHGCHQGQELACALLYDLIKNETADSLPKLSALGEQVMFQLTQIHSTTHVLH